MRDRLLIGAGLVLFVATCTFPMWHALGAARSAAAPSLLPAVAQGECVAARSYMRTSHMQLLLLWRDSAVRHEQREFTTTDGTHYRISLSGTCLGQCHPNKAQFCDGCHDYVAATTPNCWNCHQSLASAGPLHENHP
jgi:hypothetical protein